MVWVRCIFVYVFICTCLGSCPGVPLQARGINYLHHCNPIIVHRDPQTPNLLVDKNFTVRGHPALSAPCPRLPAPLAPPVRCLPASVAPSVFLGALSRCALMMFSYGVWQVCDFGLSLEQEQHLSCPPSSGPGHGHRRPRLPLPPPLGPPPTAGIVDVRRCTVVLSFQLQRKPTSALLYVPTLRLLSHTPVLCCGW